MADTASGRQQLALALAGGVVLGEPRHTHRSGAARGVGLLACWGAGAPLLPLCRGRGQA